MRVRFSEHISLVLASAPSVCFMLISSASKPFVLRVALATLLAASLTLGFVSPSEAVRNTGTPNFSGSEFTSGLNEVARFVGKYQASTDADGYDSNGDVQLQIVRPDGGTLVAAYLTSLSSLDDGAYDPPTTTLDGDSVTYSYRTDYGGYANHLADVTTIVSDFLTGASPTNANYTSPFSGATDSDLFDIAATLETTAGLTYSESQTQYQGLMLTVVFEDTNQANDSTVIVMFGNAAAAPEQQTKFNFTELTSDAPAESWMAVGIAWSAGGSGEVSTIEASTNIASRPDCSSNPSAAGCITKTAGRFNDGQDTGPQQLITYGGVGDDRANGFGTVTQANDDELYKLDGLLKTGASELTLFSANTSTNDNFGMLTVYLPFASNPEITFDANGGTGSMPNQSSLSSTAIDANAFERNGYSFAGWEDSAGNPYSNQATYSFTSSTTLFAQWTENTPAPYSGPIITDIGEDNISTPYQTFGGETVRVDGERLSTVNRVFVDGKEGVVLSAAEDHFIMTVPEGITAGTYDLVVNSALGNLTYLDGFVVSSESENVSAANAVCEGVEPSWWTQRISDTQAKAYIKCPEVGQKYRILQQTGGSGEYTSIFAKTLTDENDSTQVFNEFGRYIVRTIDLEEINRIRIRVDDVELWKVRYNQ